MIYVFDIDDTICTTPKSEQNDREADYESATPKVDRIKKVNQLYDEGHTIYFLTARGMGRHKNHQMKAYCLYDLTYQQLINWGVKFHELFLGKPSGDIYIDDKGANDFDFFKDRKKEMEHNMEYDKYNMYVKEKFSSLIKDVDVIFELGARDGLYTKEINQHYSPREIHSFECNPNSIEKCKSNLEHMNNVKFNNVAVVDYVGEIDFYQADRCYGADDGSSSIFNLSKLSGMTKTSVNCTTLDTYCESNSIKKIDLICADIEGAEVKAFTNQNILNNTKYIISEVQLNKHWKIECPTVNELESVIEAYGFQRAEYIDEFNGHGGTALYINNNIE